MEDTSDTFIELKSSDAAYDDVLPQTDDLIITVSSPSYLTNDRSSGLVNEESIEQLRSVEILAQKSTSEVIETSEPDTAGKEIKTSDAANDDVVPQKDDLIVTVPSSSTLTDNQFSGLENEESVEIVAEKSTGEEIDEMPKLIKTSEPQMEDTAGKDIEIKTSDAANDDILLQNDDLIVTVSSPLILTVKRYSGLVNGESFEKLGSVESVADKSKVEETDEMAKLITTHEPQMEDTAGKDIELKTSDAANADVLRHNDDLIIALSSPSTLADNWSSGLVNETSYEQIGTVEIFADKSAIDETDEKPKLIKTPKPDMEGTDGKEMVIKTSTAANGIVLPQNVDLIVAVSSPYTLSNIRSSGLVNGEIFEQLGSVEIVADKSTIEEINEMPKLMKTPEPDMEDTAGTDIKIKTSNAANDEVLPQNDDLVVAVSSPSTLTDNQSSGLVNEESFEQLGSVEIVADKSEIEEIDEMPTLIKTPRPEKSGKKPKFNLRKSLAWDSAFFTSDGVLDADELSTMIEGGEKGVKHQLPGIEEEVYRSMDSISTLASDNLSLECLEAELFDDIRASIQKSNRVSNLNNSNIKVSSGKKDIQPKVSNSSKKVDLDYGKRPAARIKDNTSTMPQPKIMSRVNSTSTLSKRASLSANHAKKDQDIAKQAHVSLKGTQALKTTLGSKVTGMIGPRRGVPKPLLSSKSSMLASSTAPKMEPARPSSSCSNSSSSSGTDIKTSASFSRRKVDSKVGKVTAGSIPKTPSRISIKNKQPPVNSRLSSRLVVSNFTSSISPASSISEWDSESSSSTSTINQRSTPRGSIDTGVSYRSSVESPSSIHPTDRKSNQNGNQTAALNASQTGPLSRPPSVQPTGLRMPSPKIGFFDGGKSGVRTPNGGLRTGPNSSNGSKVGKIPPPKTAAPTNMKPNLQKTTPKLTQEQPSSKPKTSSALQGVKSFSVPQNDSYKQANSGNTSVSKIDTPDSDRVEMLKSASEVLSNECLTIVKDNKVDKPITDGSRTPFAVKNSVSAANKTEVDVTEKTVSLSFMETQHKENSELI